MILFAASGYPPSLCCLLVLVMTLLVCWVGVVGSSFPFFFLILFFIFLSLYLHSLLSYENGDKLEPIVKDIQLNSDIISMDRWSVTITPTDGSAVSAGPNKFVMNNYFRYFLSPFPLFPSPSISLSFHPLF